MKKFIKWFFIFCSLFTISIGISIYFLPTILKNQIIKNLDENLTQKTTIGDIKFNPLTLEFIINDFKIADSNNITTASFNQLIINLLLEKSIKEKNISFKDIILKDAFLNIIQEKDGRLNLQNIIKSSSEKKDEKKEKEKTTYEINLANLKLDNLNFNFEDKKTDTKINSKDINIDLNSLLLNQETVKIKDIKVTNSITNIIDKQNDMQINVKNIKLNIYNFINDKNGLFVEKTDLIEPNILVTLFKKESNNPKLDNQNIVRTENNDSKLKLNIGPVNIIKGTFIFEDKNLPLDFKTTISDLHGKISEFKNSESSSTKLEVKGVIDEYGVAKITGIVHPNNIKLLTDINLIFNNIAIKNFTPYSGKFLGRAIKNGKLDLNLKYNIQKSNLDAQNSIVISKLELGDNIESSDAVSLPLEIAIALLEDSNGVIDINLPVSGNIDDPQFSLSSIVWKAFVNLITKAVTAPFSLLANIFNFNEDEIKSVRFNDLEDEITPIQKETLDKIAQILKAKKEISIELIPSYKEDNETYALKKQNYLARKDDDRNLKKEEIEELISKENVKITDLEKIAKNRVSNINNYLVKDKKINPKQIVISNKIENSNSSININIAKIK